MPNIAAALKQEIVRVARRQSKSELEQAKRALAAYRKQLTELRRRLQALERQVKSGLKQAKAPEVEEESEEGRPNLRFRPAGLKAHRERLGLSAQQAGRLMGVSALSVYKWESGKTRPRAKQLEAIAELRGLGKREAAARLERIAAG